MTKKLLSLLLVMTMLFSVFAVGVAASETDETVAANEEATADTSENTDESTEKEVEKKVTLKMDNSYLPNATVTIKGSAEGVNGVIVEIVCDEDRVNVTETVNVSKFVSTGVKFQLDDATVGAEYVVTVYDFDDEDVVLAEDSFLIKKNPSSADKADDGSNKVTIWVEGLTNRYIEETVVNLDVLDDDERNVYDLAKYLLKDVDRNYKDNKKKITAIASTETGSTYTLKDNSTSKSYEDCVWGFFKNGVAIYDEDWTQTEITGGDEIIIYYGEPGEVGYPVITVSPDAISVKDKVQITIENQVTDPDTGEVTKEPVSKGKVYFIKRGSQTTTSYKTTNTSGVYSFDATSSWITTNQGGQVMAAYYQSSSKPLKMVSVKKDLVTDREGTFQAYVRIEGAHKTLLARTKSAKSDEYDLYNFMLEVLKKNDIEYEVNDDENNFIYFESKSTTGYSNENGDITRDSGWYVVVNDVIYTPDDDLEDVDIYANDEILFYFGDKDTIPVVYYKVDGDLQTEKKVYVYFYSDADMTDPIDDMDVYFDGDEYSDKRLRTNSDGRVTLPTVEYKGKYKLWWGEQVTVKSDVCPEAVYGEAELSFTGTTKPTTSTPTTTKPTSSKNNEDDDDDDDWTSTTKATQPKTEPKEWDTGDYTGPTEDETDFVPGPSKYYPDQNIDSWAVENVNKAYEYNLMSGTAKGYFEPQREITRAEFTAIICRILDLDTDANFTVKFDDVKKSDWYFGYVMAAYNAGYVNGMSDTTFAPNNYITREEIAVMISRILNVTGNEADVAQFKDADSIANWAKIYVAAVNQTGIMKGDQFGQFLPKSQVNRQTVATIAVRLYELLHTAW